MLPVFDERYLEDEIPDTDWLEFRKITTGVFQLHFNDVPLKKSEVVSLARFFERQIQTGQCWFYGIIENEAIEKHPELIKLAERAGFRYDHSIDIGDFYSLYIE